MKSRQSKLQQFSQRIQKIAVLQILNLIDDGASPWQALDCVIEECELSLDEVKGLLFNLQGAEIPVVAAAPEAPSTAPNAATAQSTGKPEFVREDGSVVEVKQIEPQVEAAPTTKKTPSRSVK